MGFGYAEQALIAILSKYGKEGLAVKEILERDEREYHAFIKKHLFFLDPRESFFTRPFIEIRDGRWFLKPNPEIEDSWLEEQTKKADEQAKYFLKIDAEGVRKK